jgi:adenosine deaminase
MTRIRRAPAHSLLVVIATAALTLSTLILISCTGPSSQSNPQGRPHIPTAAETRAENRLNAAKHYGMGELYALLKPFPKGADLHMHLSGAVYAETFIAEAVRQGTCVAPVDAGKPPSPIGKDAVQFVAPVAGSRCGLGAVPASTALTNQALYDNLVDSFSLRAFVPTEGINGHDQFFSTFDRFDPKHDRGASLGGEWLDEVATRAAQQNEQYLEAMQTPSTATAASFQLGNKFGWPAMASGTALDPLGDATGTSKADLDALRTKLLAGGLRDEVAREQKELENGLSERERIEHCGQPGAAPACLVKIRYLYQVLRAFPPQVVFAQTLIGFEMASVDPNVVGLNFVQPEDARMAMSEYNRQMHMLDYLHGVYPKVHISLHAGELALGLVPPEGLKFHIREAIELGHAERIGHGVDVLYEDRPFDLLKEMAARHVDVEINLTSNDGILGVKGRDHPLAAYLAAHVPFSLSTDDEGVSRIDLTHEYARAVEEQNLSYIDLKHSARDSLEHSFLPGESLWAQPDDFDHMKSVCDASGATPSSACSQFLNANEKAAQQWELERRLAAFEASQP